MIQSKVRKEREGGINNRLTLENNGGQQRDRDHNMKIRQPQKPAETKPYTSNYKCVKITTITSKGPFTPEVFG